MTTQKQAVDVAKALKAAGFDASAIAEILTGQREQDGQVDPITPRARKTNTFHEKVIKARVPCAYGVESCGRFAPNGVGSRQHTTCPKGRAALAKARK